MTYDESLEAAGRSPVQEGTCLCGAVGMMFRCRLDGKFNLLKCRACACACARAGVGPYLRVPKEALDDTPTEQYRADDDEKLARWQQKQAEDRAAILAATIAGRDAQ